MSLSEIQDWIRSEEAKINKAGIADFVFKVQADTILACGFIDGTYWARSGSTPEEAAATLRALMPNPNEQAKALREKARKLLREAVELEVSAGGAR